MANSYYIAVNRKSSYLLKETAEAELKKEKKHE
ncbi:hypothetical protein IMSAGC013_01712 [Lachnospiraceae bacterium]|jgi:hypothetical protein|nr:hypothetical protein IMSAGC013_01712 [Lachnospiraceae bacterium]